MEIYSLENILCCYIFVPLNIKDMKNIIAFAGSDSKTSINKQLATYTSSLVENATINILDLNDFILPLYGIDLEKENGIPDNAHKFLDLIKASDGIILSLAEHNGAYSTAFKNLFDWMSRIDGKLWSNKPMLLMATSPGVRGGASVLEIAKGLEKEALEDKYFVDRKLYPNVDFYSGIIYRALGIPVAMFTVMFAVGRLPGWIAQWKEMRENSEPIGRPRQLYVGEPSRSFKEFEER